MKLVAVLFSLDFVSPRSQSLSHSLFLFSTLVLAGVVLSNEDPLNSLALLLNSVVFS